MKGSILIHWPINYTLIQTISFSYGKNLLTSKFKEKNGKNKSPPMFTSNTTHNFYKRRKLNNIIL
jgi:hypothetical protein